MQDIIVVALLIAAVVALAAGFKASGSVGGGINSVMQSASSALSGS